MSALARFILGHAQRLGLPLLSYPGASLIGASIRQMVTDAQTQAAAQAALHARYPSPFALCAMDLSVEAEAFGCQVLLTTTEVPTVLGRLVTTRKEAEALRVPEPGAGRTAVCLETVRRLRQLPGKQFVLACMVGPLSLAARLCGVSEALGLTVDDPELLHLLVSKSARFLSGYAQALKAAGADGLIVAEPTAGLVSPRALGEFSSAYLRPIVAAVDDEGFSTILHNCAARLVHLPAVLQAGTRICHFGAPMDLPAALKQVPPDRILCGNLDPAKLFVNGTPAEMSAASRSLLDATRSHPNFVLSSGCDVPPGTPLANLDAFYEALAQAGAAG